MKLLPKQDDHQWWRDRYANRRRIVVEDERSCAKALRYLERVDAAGFDTETDTVDRVTVRPVTAQISHADTDIIFSPDYVPEMKPWVDRGPRMLGFESKFELWAMENCGLKWKGPVEDAQITDYLIDENVKDYDLKTRCAAIFKEKKRPDWKTLFKGRKASEIWNSSDRELFIDYSCADSADHLRLHENRAEALRQWPHKEERGTNMYDDFYCKSEVPLTSVLYEMERVGALVDTEYLGELHEIAQRTMEKIQRKFYREIDFEKLPKKDKKAVKGDFGGFSEKLLNSPQQLMHLFYNTLGYPEQYNYDKNKLTGEKTKKLTTDDDALEELASQGYPAAVLLRDNRSVKKLDSTYLVGLVEHADFRGYVHTNFMQAFTSTGRLSSREPNLQNIPRPDTDDDMAEYMRQIRLGIRGAFIAPEGYLIVGGDYSQIETRLMAHMSGDENMIRACLESDIYSAMAAILFHKPKEFFAKINGEWVNKKAGRIRQIVKAIVLGIGYGKQAKSIARDLKITEEEAQGFLKMYFQRFPKFAAWMKRQIAKAKDEGFIRTITGRYRRLPDLNLPMYTKAQRKANWFRVTSAERMALNSPVQGSAYDVMKQAMLNMSSSGLLEQYGVQMFCTVHDELLTYCPKENAQVFAPKMQEIMMHPFKKDFRVPLDVSMFMHKVQGEKRYGAFNWAEAK
jgi:DNA polymerase-1